MEKLTVLHVSTPRDWYSCGFIYARAENGRVWCYSFGGEAPFAEGVTVSDPLGDDSHWYLLAHSEVPESLQLNVSFESMLHSPSLQDDRWKVIVNEDEAILFQCAANCEYECRSHYDVGEETTDSLEEIAAKYLAILNKECFLGVSDWHF